MTDKRFFPDINGESVEACIFNKEVLHPNESKLKKERIMKPKTYIELRVKGQNQIMVRPLQEKDINRFPDAWRYFQGEDVSIAEGIPVSDIEGIEPGMVVALKSRGIHYAEELAKMQPEQVYGIKFGVQGLIQKARKMTGLSSSEQVVANVKKEKDELEKRVDGIESKLDKVIELMTAQNQPPAPKKTRKKKSTPSEEES
jgi:hypothetical protein